MKDFLAIFITILLFLLWFVPPYILYSLNKDWTGLYPPIIIITVLWGNGLYVSYFKK